MRNGDAQAVEYQLKNQWPLDGTKGIVTQKGRTFHVSEDCPGYRRGPQEADDKGRQIHPVEIVTARVARSRGKSACLVCWKNGQSALGRR